MRIVLTIVWFCFFLPAWNLRAEDDNERLILIAKLNGEPIRFALDTGAGAPFVITSATAQRLGMQIIPFPKGSPTLSSQPFAIGWTKPQKLDFGFASVETSFLILNIPDYIKPNFEGLIGWLALKANCFSMDSTAHTITLFTNSPANFKGWVTCHIQTNNVLILDIPGQRNFRPVITLDSGSSDGLQLSLAHWNKWKIGHTNHAMTKLAYYVPDSGLTVCDEAWADKISLGKLSLTSLPVMPTDSFHSTYFSAIYPHFEATLGLAAMKRLDIFIDGPDNLAYLRPRKDPPSQYQHNRLGVVFTPTSGQNDDLIAHVANGSPGFEAGIRENDILLKIDDLDVTQWRTDPKILPLSRFWAKPTGTQIEFILKRGDKIFKTTGVLRNILPPD